MLGHLFVFDGAFGQTKVFLNNYLVSNTNRRAARLRPGLLPKYTIGGENIEIVPITSVDLIEVEIEQFNEIIEDPECCYEYELTDQRYAIRCADVAKELSEYPVVFLVVRDRKTISRLKKDFPDHVHAIYVYINKEDHEADIRERFKSDYVDFHLNRCADAWSEYIYYFEDYCHVLINTMNKDDVYKQLDKIVERFCPTRL